MAKKRKGRRFAYTWENGRRTTGEKRTHRMALTLLLAGLIFCFMLITIGLAALTSYLLMRVGVVLIEDSADLTVKRIILLLSLNSLILGAIIVMVASKFPLIPINKIVNQMNRLADGDFSVRLNFSGPLAKHPTIREIIDNFNKMAKELESTELLRGDFINNFSHEFKTPIVSIAGFAKLLKRGQLSDEQRTEYAAVIEEESRRLAAMATNVLNLTRFENQTILTDIAPFNLSEQLRSSILSLEDKWSKKGIEWEVALEEYTLYGNRDMLRQVWLNLLDNAIKFSPPQGAVSVGITVYPDACTVTVRNRAPDIPPETRRKLFNKFYQGDESHTQEGNGIGLALVKQVVHLHGGEVTVESADGVVTFAVTLPNQPEGERAGEERV